MQVRWAVRIQSWLDRSEDFDIGSVSERTLEPRGADEKCSMGGPSVREGESVDIEIRVLKHAEKRSRCKEGRIDKDEKKRRKMKAESVSPESISRMCHLFFVVWIRRGSANRP